MENKIINCNGIKISNKNALTLIATMPIRIRAHSMDMVGKIKDIANKFGIGFIYKILSIRPIEQV